ncbi:MAG: TonB-dependent receptor [Alphaproteobacteria bacterium]|nr:TonB-dependent receptor [Alphaproteobacteria bacterium]
MSLLCRGAVYALLSSSVLSPLFWNAFAGDAAETVIVTARRNPGEPAIVARARERLSRTPGAVAVVAAEAYEKKVAMGFPDLLQWVPGVLSNKRYGEESRLSIRGSGIDQAYHQRGVLLAQDGVPFADADGFSDFQKVDALSARYIEVYKGGNALRFGGAQLGGAINLVTPNGRTAQAPHMLRLEGGAFGTVRGAASAAGESGRIDAYGLVDGLVSEGYRTHGGQEQVRGTLNVGYSLGEEREIRLVVYGAEIRQDVPGTLSLSDALYHPRRAGAGVVANDWKRDQDVARLSLRTHWRFDDSLVFEGGVYGTWTDLHHPIPIVIDQDIANQGAFGRFDWTGEVAGLRADLFFGASYRHGTNDQGLFVNAGGQNGFQFGDSHQAASGLDVFAEGRLFVAERLALVMGGSWGRATRDYRDNRNAANDRSKRFDWFAPRVGLLWEDESGIQVYANVTRSVEPPHYGALVQAPHPGFVPIVPQDAWTVEAGTRGRRGAFIWDLTFYRAWLEGELLSFSAQTGYPAAFFNAGKTIHQGIEASLDWRLIDGAPGEDSLTLRQTYAWSDFTFDGDPVYGDNRLPVVPTHQYRAALRYEAASGFYIEPAVDWRIADVYVDYANTLKAPGYVLFNLSAGWTLEDGVTLFVDARNLADRHHVAEFGAVTDARTASAGVFYPGEGRSVFAGVILKL